MIFTNMEFFDDCYQFILAQYFIITMMDCAESGVSEIEWAHPSYRQTKNSG